MDGLLNTLKFVLKMFINVMNFVVAVQTDFVKCESCNIIDCYNGFGM